MPTPPTHLTSVVNTSSSVPIDNSESYPSRTTNVTKVSLDEEINKISLTTNLWKSKNQNIEYMVITGHFIDSNWKLQKRVLSFVHVPPPCVKKKLVIDCPTRWNSTYDVLSSALKFKDAFPRFQDREPTYDCLPSLDEWEKVEMKVNNMKFMVLSKMTTDILIIPISIVASKSTFSAGGRVIDPYYSSLKPNIVQTLICHSDWVRVLHGVKKNQKVVEDC
ncbi:uncharacterized protein [Aristolochia californica]|uniref:uncharacterized protein n=1 Tax=Aristolochia californica TaxID=171875 RepID=UPI0035E0369A